MEKISRVQSVLNRQVEKNISGLAKLHIPDLEKHQWKRSVDRKICFADAKRIKDLPVELQTQIAKLLKGYPRGMLKPDVRRLLDANRSMCQVEAKNIVPIRPNDSVVDPALLPRVILEYGEREAMAFVASQMPFLYAPIQKIMEEIQLRIPEYRPTSMMDFGCGPGTAIWAAQQFWSDSIKLYLGVDISEPMIKIAEQLLDGSNENSKGPIVENIKFRRFLPISTTVTKYDLVVASFVLSDLPDDGVRTISIDALWERTNDVLILVERGTPEGFRIIAEARKRMLFNAGYLDSDGNTIANPAISEPIHIVAPCPHEKKCPMMGSWCHFSQRLQLNNFQMETWHMKKGFEDQKYSYLVLRKRHRPTLSNAPNNSIAGEQIEHAQSSIDETTSQPSPTAKGTHSPSFHWPRLIRRPLKRSGHIHLDYCDVDGTFKRTVVTKCQGKAKYQDARKSKWGDLWPHDLKNPPRLLTTLYIKPYRNRFKQRGGLDKPMQGQKASRKGVNTFDLEDEDDIE